MSALAANPLRVADGTLPDFAAIRPDHVTPAVDRWLADAEAALESAVGDAVQADYDALSATLDMPVERLSRGWAAVCHLQAVADTPALRAAHADNLPRVTAFMTRLGADGRLYAKTRAIAEDSKAAALSPVRRKALADALRDFVLGGAELKVAERERFAQIQERMAELSQRFGDHVLDATDGFALHVSADDLDGVPADVREAARAAAADEGRAGFKLTLQQPCYGPVMRFATNRALREQMYRSQVTRASDLGPAALDNSATMRELLALRQEEAALLGHANYAELSLVPKMAGSPEDVLAFLRDLARRARPFAEREDAELRDFAARELGLPDLQAWDRPFAAERLRERRFGFRSEDLKPYFTLPRVLDGLFRIAETLFGVAIRPATAPVWHPDVRHYVVEHDGEPVAAFYADLHARAGKQGGAWMDEARPRWQPPGDAPLQRPVAHLVCNFAAPVGERPVQLTHDDVLTLFHEFGHGLHLMLTRVDELAVSGLSGVEWDAVEMPSQFMENFAWEWTVLQRLTAHVDCGEPLPRALFDKMLAARRFHGGLALMRHCEYALFDMRLHLEPDAGGRVMALAEEVRDEVAVVRAPAFDRYPHAFDHLFDGGYAAGYYGYLWAEVLSADAFGAFEDAGVLDPACGRRFREAVLEVGGSRPALESFRAFRGREPRLDALLRQLGMA
jgi:oligopeptidase A